LFCRIFFPLATENSQNKAMQRVVFFDGRETIFRNQGEIFTYIPHNEVRNLTAFFADDGFSVEYDYHFWTNNFGLVQDADIAPERASLLLLGDSFTEGQGAEPWFRLVSPEIDKLGYQPVNGGLLGTGFEQWLKLGRYLAAENVRIRKVVVLFISLDYNRSSWNFMPNDFRCLSSLQLCRVDESHLYRLPPWEELSLWIAEIAAARASRAGRGPAAKHGWLATRAAALLPASYHVYTYFRSGRAEQQSRAAIGELIGMYGRENIAFFHLPQKDEIDSGPNNLGLRARRSVKEAGGKLFDGFKLCRLTSTDYYSNDEHPNGAGYSKIAICLTNVLKEVVAAVQ